MSDPDRSAVAGPTRLPGEHPRLPVLRVELHGPRPASRQGRDAVGVLPAHARVWLSPVGVLSTADPARLRRLARQLLAAARQLEAHAGHGTPSQGRLFDPSVASAEVARRTADHGGRA